MITGWKSNYETSPVISGDIDNYRIEFFFEQSGNVPVNGGLNGRLNGGLNGGLKELFEFISNNQGVQAKRISEVIDKPLDTIDKQIKRLVDKDLIERRGSRKTGGYYVK